MLEAINRLNNVHFSHNNLLQLIWTWSEPIEKMFRKLIAAKKEINYNYNYNYN